MGPRNQPKRTRIRTAQLLALAVVATAVSVVVPVAPASADPSAADWLKLRMCESSNNYQIDTGNNHYGAYQFDLATWHGVGGLGYPYLARPADQDARALILYRQRGWQPWQCATIVGLHDDHDARRYSELPVAGPAKTAPPYPGTRAYHIGDNNTTIKAFQNEMHLRGFAPVGTGGFGPITQAMVIRLQQRNGLVANGSLGTTTWNRAWTGWY
jgi:resuscitation-promoting factor RpfA